MILNTFLPWGMFLFTAMVISGRIHYTHYWFCYTIVAAFAAFWLVLCAVAIWARKGEADPTWFTYAAVMVGIAIFMGMGFGDWLYENYYRMHYEIQDMKVVAHLDASRENGQNHMDGGVFYFADGNMIDPKMSWHFKHGTDYCATSSSDFRCGSFDDASARSGLRITDDKA